MKQLISKSELTKNTLILLFQMALFLSTASYCVALQTNLPEIVAPVNVRTRDSVGIKNI